MNNILHILFEKYENQILQTNSERNRESLPRLGKIEVKILGQMSLFADRDISKKFTLARTADFDALITGDWIARLLFRNCLKELGLIYDDLSNEIWIPNNSTWNEVYESENLHAIALNPLYTLLSKAIKAKEKNKFLIAEALLFYGDELSNLIIQNGGDINYFLNI